jgi:hypothetical protein
VSRREERHALSVLCFQLCCILTQTHASKAPIACTLSERGADECQSVQEMSSLIIDEDPSKNRTGVNNCCQIAVMRCSRQFRRKEAVTVAQFRGCKPCTTISRTNKAQDNGYARYEMFVQCSLFTVRSCHPLDKDSRKVRRQTAVLFFEVLSVGANINTGTITVIFFFLRNYEMKEEIYCFVIFNDSQIWTILYHNETKYCLSWNLFRPERNIYFLFRTKGIVWP